MNSVRYVGLDVHRDTISAAVLNESGRLISAVDSGHASCGHSGFHRRDCAHSARQPSRKNPSAWLYDLLVHTARGRLVVCNPRMNSR